MNEFSGRKNQTLVKNVKPPLIGGTIFMLRTCPRARPFRTALEHGRSALVLSAELIYTVSGKMTGSDFEQMKESVNKPMDGSGPVNHPAGSSDSKMAGRLLSGCSFLDLFSFRIKHKQDREKRWCGDGTGGTVQQGPGR